MHRIVADTCLPDSIGGRLDDTPGIRSVQNFFGGHMCPSLAQKPHPPNDQIGAASSFVLSIPLWLTRLIPINPREITFHRSTLSLTHSRHFVAAQQAATAKKGRTGPKLGYGWAQR